MDKMKIPNIDQWKYQGLAEDLARMIRQDHDFYSQPGRLEEFILYAFDKVYNMNIKTSDSIPVTDLTEIPELFERAKDRWKKGTCH